MVIDKNCVRRQLVFTVKDRCRVCYTCLRECPVKAIKIINGQAEVIHERCIGCGNCIKVCSQDAKVYLKGIDEAFVLLGGGKKIIACIDAARLAPSACNSQPWKFIVVDDKEKHSKMADFVHDKILGMNKFAEKAGAFIVVVEEKAVLSAKIAEKIKSQNYAQMDLGMATQNLCLMAAEQGLGTCILGWFEEKNIKKLLHIPAGRRVRLVISVGYPETDKIRSKIRKNIDDILSFNDY